MILRFYEKIEFTKAKRSDIDEIVDMFRYTIKRDECKWNSSVG